MTPATPLPSLTLAEVVDQLGPEFNAEGSGLHPMEVIRLRRHQHGPATAAFEHARAELLARCRARLFEPERQRAFEKVVAWLGGLAWAQRPTVPATTAKRAFETTGGYACLGVVIAAAIAAGTELRPIRDTRDALLAVTKRSVDAVLGR